MEVKTIQIPIDLYEKLMDMAKEVKTQDNRGTRAPYFFQIQEDVREYGIDSGYEDGIAWRSDDCIIHDDDDDYPDEMKQAGIGWDDHVQYDGSRWECVGYRRDVNRTGAFITEKSIENHIRINGHNYRGPIRTWLEGAFRNTDLDTIFELMGHLAEKE